MQLACKLHLFIYLCVYSKPMVTNCKIWLSAIAMMLFVMVPINAQEITFRLDSVGHILPGMPYQKDSLYAMPFLSGLRNKPDFRIVNDKLVLPDNSYVPFGWKNSKELRPIDAEKTGYLKGEYSVSGPIRVFRNSVIYGAGTQRNFIGVGRSNSASVGYFQWIGDRVLMDMSIGINKYSVPRFGSTSVGSSASLSYLLNEKMTFKVFGSYATGLSHFTTSGSYGASFAYDLTNWFGMEVGANRFFDPMTNRWNTVPIVSPYIILNDKSKIGFDVGFLVKEAYDKWRKKPKIRIETTGPMQTNRQNSGQFVRVVGGNPALPGSYMPKK